MMAMSDLFALLSGHGCAGLARHDAALLHADRLALLALHHPGHVPTRLLGNPLAVLAGYSPALLPGHLPGHLQ